MSAGSVGRRVGPLAAVALTVTVAGCTTMMDGAATRDPGFHPGEVTTVLLRAGNYPSAPKPAVKPSAELSVLIEAQRMADAVIGPWEVDPALTDLDFIGTSVVKSAKALGMVIPGEPVSDIATANGFINGFTTSRGTPASAPGRHLALNIMVLRFPGPDQAAAAAAAFTAQVPPLEGSTGRHPIAIPGHPEAPATAVTLKDGHPSVSTFVPHGSYVFFGFTQTDDTAESAAAEIGKALDLQGPRIDQFTPTDPAQFPTMNPDPTGLLARSLPYPKATVNDGVFTSRAALHFNNGDPTKAAEGFAAQGVDIVVRGKATLFQARDAAAATALAADVAASFADGADPGPAVPGMPAAKCFAVKEPAVLEQRFRGVATANRYVITAFSQQSADVTQQISAQYLMLVGK